mgnify:CR=1 FL=1
MVADLICRNNDVKWGRRLASLHFFRFAFSGGLCGHRVAGKEPIPDAHKNSSVGKRPDEYALYGHATAKCDRLQHKRHLR